MCDYGLRFARSRFLGILENYVRRILINLKNNWPRVTVGMNICALKVKSAISAQLQSVKENDLSNEAALLTYLLVK